jgi:hypothetical protein
MSNPSKRAVVYKSLLLSFFIFSLQWGFSYWVSGALFGLLTITYLSFDAGLHIDLVKKPSSGSILFWFASALLSVRVLQLESPLLLQLRIIFFIFLYTIIFAGCSFPLYSTQWNKIAPQIIMASSITSISLLLFYIISLVPGSPLSAEKFVFFQDRFLVSNKGFSNVDEVFHAMKFSDPDSYYRIALMYGEPSFLALILGILAFVSIYALSLRKYRFTDPLLSFALNPYLIYLSIFSSLFTLLRSGSMYGILFIIFLCFFSFLIKLFDRKYWLIILPILSLVFLLGIVNLLPKEFAEYITSRFTDTLSGTDASSSNRIYPIMILFKNLSFNSLFGFGSSTGEIIYSYGFQSADVGLVSSTLVYGLFFIFFLASSLYSISFYFDFCPLSFAYCILLLFAWSQSGNIFSIDKLFICAFPLPLIFFDRAIAKQLQ